MFDIIIIIIDEPGDSRDGALISNLILYLTKDFFQLLLFTLSSLTAMVAKNRNKYFSVSGDFCVIRL